MRKTGEIKGRFISTYWLFMITGHAHILTRKWFAGTIGASIKLALKRSLGQCLEDKYRIVNDTAFPFYAKPMI